jgi:hypothetical protein
MIDPKSNLPIHIAVLALLVLVAPLITGCGSIGTGSPATANQTQDALIGLAATAACHSLTHGHPEKVAKAQGELTAAEALLTKGVTYQAIEDQLLRSIRTDPRSMAYVQAALTILRAQFPNTSVIIKPASANLAHVQAGIDGCRAGLAANAG